MQATAFLVIAIVVGVLLIAVAGLSWFVAVIVAFGIFSLPVLFTAALLRRRTRGRFDPGVPSSHEASYHPADEPEIR